MLKIESIELKYNTLGEYTNIYIKYNINNRIEYCKGVVYHHDNQYKITYEHIARLIYISTQIELGKKIY